MRILIVYPGPTHSTYDVAHGYDLALRALGHTVEAFAYHKYIAFYNEALEEQVKRNPEYHKEETDPFFLASERVAIRVVDFVPDVVLIVAGGALHRRAHELINRLGVKIALLLTESPYIDSMQELIIKNGHAGVAFTNDKNSVKPLTACTGAHIEYLPHSFNPAVHHPGAPDVSLLTDVLFHGTLWPERQALFAGLADLPHKTLIGGCSLDTPDHNKAIIGNAHLAAMYRSTKIALNHHRIYTDTENGDIVPGTAYSLGPRAYEIAACGAFQLCDGTRAELREIFGDSVATYRDAQDLRAKIAYFLDERHAAERNDMAGLAWGKVQGYTFEDRASQILIPVLEEVING